MKKLLLILALLMPFAVAGQGFRTTLKGTVTGRDSKALVLRQMGERGPGVATIPIEDGKFEYTFEGGHMLRYSLVFEEEFQRGSWRDLDFFPDADVVEFALWNEDNWEKNEVRGGVLNDAATRFETEIKKLFYEEDKALSVLLDSLRDAGKYSSPEAEGIYAKLKASKTTDENVRLYDEMEKLRNDGRRDLTPEARAVDARYDDMVARQTAWAYEYILANPNLHSYSMLIERIYNRYYPEAQLFDKLYATLSKANPGHPYNDIVATAINAIKMRAGGKFIDFSAPTMDGTMHKLSEEIEGRIALIDLWASWCGPCIVKARRAVPIYNEYKERGFTVVGVAREFDDLDDLEIALRREKFPWLNLVELDDRAGIWAKYGASSLAGSTFLVDREGNIVKTNPTEDEIREYLETNLK